MAGELKSSSSLWIFRVALYRLQLFSRLTGVRSRKPGRREKGDPALTGEGVSLLGSGTSCLRIKKAWM